ncbi:GPI mannosyltransferase 3 [Anabrus simplex]|uniref:GPI mannosyltransferase 3 n=1 Tax=Anabrus simplex TaxID=316456 RepID=UPI0034DCED8F
MSPLKALFVILVVRLSAVFIIQTSFVPDEYWQSLEVAHYMIYNYGYITWEWKEGIRSCLYPSLIAVIYKVLYWMNLDSVDNLILMPRVLQALISSVSDFCLWLWLCREIKTSGGVALFSIAIPWFWFYCCSRTLSNTLETSLTAMALYFFPWKNNKSRSISGSTSFLWFVGLACILRPTAAILWIPLCIYHILSASRNFVTVICREYLFIGAIYIVVSAVVDSFFYKHLIFTPFNFMYFNVIQNVGKFYGTHPAHWYLTSGLPVVIGAHLIPFFASCGRFVIIPLFRYHFYKIKPPLFQYQYQKIMFLCVVSITWTLSVYSCLPHKEFRFILPVLPMVLFISYIWLIYFHKTAHRFVIVLLDLVLLCGAVIPSLYLGTVHQCGTRVVMQELASDAIHDPHHTDILFLMPCHSTPLYSHLHVNVSTRFLTCDPFHKGDRDEADEFYESPVPWLVTYFRNHSSPSHIIIYDKLYPNVSNFLLSRNYSVSLCIFHAHIVEGRVGNYIYILQQNLQEK